MLVSQGAFRQSMISSTFQSSQRKRGLTMNVYNIIWTIRIDPFS